MTASLLTTRENVHCEIYYYPQGSLRVRVDISAGDLLWKFTVRNVHYLNFTELWGAYQVMFRTLQIYQQSLRMITTWQMAVILLSAVKAGTNLADTMDYVDSADLSAESYG
jgi:hypothetical protein